MVHIYVCKTHLPEILDDDEDVVAPEHEPVEVVLVVSVDVLPDGAALLPHVIPFLGPLVLNLKPEPKEKARGDAYVNIHAKLIARVYVVSLNKTFLFGWAAALD